jgi:hypothetical protein
MRSLNSISLLEKSLKISKSQLVILLCQIPRNRIANQWFGLPISTHSGEVLQTVDSKIHDESQWIMCN